MHYCDFTLFISQVVLTADFSSLLGHPLGNHYQCKLLCLLLYFAIVSWHCMGNCQLVLHNQSHYVKVDPNSHLKV